MAVVHGEILQLLNCMAQGMAEIQKSSFSLFRGILFHHTLLNHTALINHGLAQIQVPGSNALTVVLQPLIILPVLNQAVFHHLAHA